MKTLLIVSTLSGVLLLASLEANSQNRAPSLVGAWQSGTGENQTTIICTEKFFSVAIYNSANRTFVGTYGGSYRLDADNYVASIEFHSMSPETVGNEYKGRFAVEGNMLTLEEESGSTTYRRLDDGKPGMLAGAWVITGRVRNGEISKMTPGARRTMKILSGTRFQWIAYNLETGEFSGTGGGNTSHAMENIRRA